MSWKEKSLDELGLVARGKSKHRPRDAAHLYDGPYPFIQTGDVKHAPLYLSTYTKTYSEEGLKQSKLWKKGTLCITIAANIADTAILDIDACFPDSVIGFVANKEVCDTKFIKYTFNTLQQQYKQFSQGAAQDNLSLEKLLSIKFKIPSLPVQQKIAGILSAYDDLIDNNRKRIALLEKAARLLYEEWFVRLQFPGHEHTPVVDGVPEGWVRKSIGEVTELSIGGGWGADEQNSKYSVAGYVIRGTDLPDLQAGAFSGIPFRFHDPKNLKNRLLKEGDIILEVSNGNLNNIGRSYLILAPVLSWFDGPMMCASFCKMLRPYNLNQAFLLSAHLVFMQESKRMDYFKSPSAAGINNFRFPGLLAEEKLLIPSDIVLEYFALEVGTIKKLTVTLAKQNQKLLQARDLLLPRLMSGELAV